MNKSSGRHYTTTTSSRGFLLEKCKLCFHLKFLQNIGIEMLLYFFDFVMRFFIANHDSTLLLHLTLLARHHQQLLRNQ